MATASFFCFKNILIESYADNNGVIIYSQEELATLVLEGHKAGFQLAIHAIGDRAMEMILNSYEKLEKPISDRIYALL